jgi:acyl-coenzyme A thioesterase PaaI-like protein
MAALPGAGTRKALQSTSSSGRILPSTSTTVCVVRKSLKRLGDGTLDLKASFLRPAFPGRLVGRGHVLHRDGDIAFLEGSLTNSDEAVVATAAATARVIALDSSTPD